MVKKHILDEIKRTAVANGGNPLGTQRFENETGIGRGDWLGVYWARWGDAVAEAGFSPNKKMVAAERNALHEKYIEFVREVGKFPVEAELRMKAVKCRNFPARTISARLGSRHKIIPKIAEYCQIRTGYDDVLALCDAAIISTSTQRNHIADEQDDTDPAKDGYIYLIHAHGTKLYKIGITKHVGHRLAQLQTGCPHKLDEVHSFRTDDPRGVERYWHQRFENRRRMSGGEEWFELSPADVRAFKRWKRLW